jgi:xylan 1,4-beta-xylosidase
VNTEVGPGVVGTPLLGGGPNGAGTAAFLAEAFMYMQDSPITRAYMEIQSIQPTLTKPNYGFAMVGMLNKTPQRLWTSGGDNTGYAMLAGRDEGQRKLQVLISNYEVPPSLMGPMNLGGILGNLTETVVPGPLGPLGTFTWLERYLPAGFQYQNNEGYNLSINNIPLGWGDLTIKQYRLDNGNNMALVTTMTILKKDRAAKSVIALSGTNWALVDGVAQGVDLIVVEGSTGSSK